MNVNSQLSPAGQEADMQQFKGLIARVANGEVLPLADAKLAFDIMMTGNATPAQMGGFLMALRTRGESVEEITGGAMALRSRVLPIKAPPDALDTCGTGGDASGSWNISTAVAFVLAGAGVTVAKHGNKAQSSKSGAADVLAALGIKLDCDMALVERSIAEARVGFLFAQRHHGAMRHVAPTRVELGSRTIFNLLGPLSNPAGTRRQLLGVYDKKWVRPMAEVLRNLGSEKVWVVHGSDGLDELTVTGPSLVAELARGEIRTFEVTPQDAGLGQHDPAALKGGDAQANAAALQALLQGGREGALGAYRDIVLLNAAAGLIIADRVQNLTEAAKIAAHSIDSGKALAALDQMRAITNEG